MAAGIVKFKRRKATALKKLDEEQQNLVRVTDILSELTRQLGPLERQSETARIYLKKKEELKILDVNMYLAESAHIREQLKETEEKYRISQGELQQTQAQFDQTKAEYERLEKELEELDTKIQEARTQAGENALKKQQRGTVERTDPGGTAEPSALRRTDAGDPAGSRTQTAGSAGT